MIEGRVDQMVPEDWYDDGAVGFIRVRIQVLHVHREADIDEQECQNHQEHRYVLEGPDDESHVKGRAVE